MTRVGCGFDIHRLQEGRKLILGGVHIAFERGLLGHSDGDVLTHAIIDALLGAAALGDAGTHFASNDNMYEGADSINLLKQVGELLKKQDRIVSNIDATIICEQPKLSKFYEAMREKLANALDISVNQISIKSKTMEGLGAIGHNEAIAAQAAALIE